MRPASALAGAGDTVAARGSDDPVSRTSGSRARLLAAACERFCADGYFAAAVDDIAAAAGVSRMTFYRHFPSKAVLAGELFEDLAVAAMPRLLSICDQDVSDVTVVQDWIAALFAADRASQQLLRVFIQAAAGDDGFAARAQQLIRSWISSLGEKLPGFRLNPDDPRDRRRWIEAWMLLYEILDQSNHAARTSGVANDPWMIVILGERFHAFAAQPSPEQTPGDQSADRNASAAANPPSTGRSTPLM